MMDGSLNLQEATSEIRIRLRDSYMYRLTDGDKVPSGMEIQGVDVIDPKMSRISHQQALSYEIDNIIKNGDQPCIVVFKPIHSNSRSYKESFATYSDPNLYAVVSAPNAMQLLGNSEQYQGLRNSVSRRVREYALI